MKKTKTHWYKEEPRNQEDHYDLQLIQAPF